MNRLTPYLFSLWLLGTIMGCGRIGYDVETRSRDSGSEAAVDAGSAQDSALEDSGDAGAVDGAVDGGSADGAVDAGGGDAGMPVGNVIFRTEQRVVPGTLGGLAAADAVCDGAARTAGLSGRFIALLSDSTTPIQDRLGQEEGWLRPDGLPVAGSLSDLVAGRLLYFPLLTEQGVVQADNMVAAALTSDFCSDYSETTGTVRVGTLANFSNFLDAFAPGASCGDAFSLYCLSSDTPTTIQVNPPANAKILFTSSTPWSPGGGLASADAHCDSLATAAELPGTYLAFLSTGAQSAAARFSGSVGPVVRPDGIALAPTREEFFDGLLQAPMSMDENGASLTFMGGWTGSRIDFRTPRSHCRDWTSTSSSDLGDFFRSEQLRHNPNIRSNCTIAMHLFCLEADLPS